MPVRRDLNACLDTVGSISVDIPLGSFYPEDRESESIPVSESQSMRQVLISFRLPVTSSSVASSCKGQNCNSSIFVECVTVSGVRALSPSGAARN